jgi:hypothetical protein
MIALGLSRALLSKEDAMPSQGNRPHRRLRVLVSLLAGLTLGLGITLGPAAAAGILDQSQALPPDDIFAARNVTFAAQTFAAGLSGTLEQVDLLLGRLDPLERNLTVQIQTVSSGTPTGVVLASAELTPADVPVTEFPNLTFVSLPLPPSASIAGTTYAIVLSDPTAAPFGGPQYFWGGTHGDPYPNGNALLTIDGGASWLQFADFDMGFKTYVTPLPASKDECKNGGWQNFSGFGNQGDCVRFVETGS